MNDFETMLNNLLADTFKNVLKVEERVMKYHSKIQLSVSEVHLLEAVGKSTTAAQDAALPEKVLGKLDRSYLSFFGGTALPQTPQLEQAEPERMKKTITNIASELNITMASVTVAVNKLVTKGFLEKEKSSVDGRITYISLTKAGEKVVKVHDYFHKQMVNSISDDLSNHEKLVLVKSIEKLNEFFKRKSLEE